MISIGFSHALCHL